MLHMTHIVILPFYQKLHSAGENGGGLLQEFAAARFNRIVVIRCSVHFCFRHWLRCATAVVNDV
jgi:hypothetical protein